MNPPSTVAAAAKTEDLSTFRTLFASPGERLALVLIDSIHSPGAMNVLEALRALCKPGSGIKAVLHKEDASELPGGADQGIAVLEPWARTLVPALVEASDSVFSLEGANGHRLPRSSILLSNQTDVPSLISLMSSEIGGNSLVSGKKAADTANYVLQNEWGVGDELLLSAVAREIVRAFPKTRVWIRSRHGFRFPDYVCSGPIPKDASVVNTIYQNPTLYGPGPHSPFPGHLVQQMLDKFALDTGLRVKAVDVRPELRLTAGIIRVPREVVLHTRPNPRLPSKDWGVPRWTELAALLRKAGVHVVQVGGKDEAALPHVEDRRGMPLHDLPDVFCRASAVVCVVGFLMHLAEATRTPAAVIYGGRETPAIDGYPDQQHLSCEPLPCKGRWGCHLGADVECPHGMKCMEQITPKVVADRVLSTLKPRNR